MIYVGRTQIRKEVFKRLKAHPDLLKHVNGGNYTPVIICNVGWRWNVEDVGLVLINKGTQYECMSAWAGLEAFVQSCIDEYRANNP